MTQRTSPNSKTSKSKIFQESNAARISALEEQLAQREAELARLSDENQRLIKETEQRATELQIINNIGQTLTEGLDLNLTLERVGERLREALKIDSLAIAAFDPKNDLAIAQYMYHKGDRIIPDPHTTEKFKFGIRFASRWAGRSWVVNTNAEKYFRRFALFDGDLLGLPKSFVMLPLLSGREVIGGMTFANYERENAFTHLPIGMLETISSNMGTAIQNVRLFEETQRLLKETEQRATELQIINNIGQTLTEGLDLQSTLERVGERLREALQLENIGIIANDTQTGLVISHYVYLKGKRIYPNRFSLSKNMLVMRFASRMGGKPLVINTNVEKNWRKFLADVPEWAEIPKVFVMVPLLAGRELVGTITIADYENENAFVNLPINLLDTIASNMGTAIQNVHLFDETQRLLKQTEQRATELQIINNIGQTLTEGLSLNSTLERVGERMREVLNLEHIGIIALDPKTGNAIARYFYSKTYTTDQMSFDKFKIRMRLSARGGGRSWVVNTNAEKSWRKFGEDIGDAIPKSFVALPLLAGRELIGGILFADFDKENAFTDISIGMLETIASNMGTAIQNVRLFDETQRLLKETEQRATELQIINNIGQTLTEGLDLNSTLERVGERLQTSLNLDTVGIVVFDSKSELGISHYMYVRGKRVNTEHFSIEKFRASIRLSMRGGGRSWIVNTNAEKTWRKYGAYGDEIAKSFVMLPLLAGKEVIGGITILDYEKENAFTDLPISLIETIASNMGTAIQNVRLFEETQRLLKETEQRATELQIINNIGQTITGDLDLNTLIEHVGDKLRETFNVKSIRIGVADTNTGFLISLYMYRNGKRVAFDESWQSKSDRYRSIMRASDRAGGRSWVVNTNAEKGWRKFALVIDEEDIPKSFVMLPLLAGREVIGGIYIPNYEKENAFTDFSIGMLETIASNMGTAIQNVRLFDETKKLFKAAEESRASAEQANKAKSTFLANMSHELRTPLNAIIGFTRIVKKKAEGALPEKQIENLDKVLISSEHLLGLINTVLDIAKIEAGRMDVIPAKFSLSALADQCATLAIPLLKPNVTLEKQVDETVGFIFSDQDKIKQIVLNLLSNAAKFTHEGTILLSVQKYDVEFVNISVADSGIGISDEALGRIFEEFQQADTSTTREYGGTGLGLAISRNLARLLGGDLTATSELDKGSTFTLTIPIRYGRKSASSTDFQPDSVQSTESHSDDIAPMKENVDRDSLKTILIVEDTELNINLLAQLLEDDYNLLIAKDGAQGVSIAQENNPDLILMDISLPIIDGYEATRRIRKTMASTPILGLSAHAMSGDDEKAKEAGCNDYLTKPVDEALLIKKLNEYLR